MKTSHPNTEKQLLQLVRLRILLIAALSFMLLVISTKATKAQSLGVAVFAEQNIMGLQKGAEVGYVTRNNLQVAYFFQATEQVTFEGSDSNYPFHGLSVSAPIKQCDGLIFSAGMKTGFVNGKYLIMTPQITTELKLFGPLALGITAGYRAGHPALGSKLSLKL